MSVSNVVIDRLPPHSDEAEKAVLGCVLVEPKVMEAVLEWSAGEPVFYVLANADIFTAMTALYREGTPVDVLTVYQRLKDNKRLEQAGGMAYLSGLPEATPSALNIEHYQAIVWEKFLARKQVATSTEIVQSIYQWDGMPEGLWARIHRLNEDWAAVSQRNTGVTPRELCQPTDLEKEYKALWWREKADQKGWAMPFELADFRIRPYEFTLLGGDSETGKSTYLKELIVCLIKQGVKCALATLEEPAAKALWVMSRQILGTHRKPESKEEEKAVWGALGFMQPNLWLYNFLGIGNWRNILDAFIYAADKLGVRFFVLDGLGLIGIGDEDLEGQGLAAAQFAAFCHTRPVHLIGVQHTVKDSEGGFKKRLRGNKRWTDFSDNLIEWERNEKKRENVTKLLAERDKDDALRKAGGLSQEDWAAAQKEIKAKLDKVNLDWDAKCTLRKQKWGEGERRNAARYLWHDWSSRQFHDAPGQGAVNYLTK